MTDEKRKQVDRAARVLTLWMLGGCRGDIRAALDMQDLSAIRTVTKADQPALARWDDDGGSHG